MPGLFSFMRDIFDGSREIRLLSDKHGHTPTGLETLATSQLQLQLPEVLAPAQYLIDAGLRPALAQRLSSTYMDFVDRYRKICQSHFDHATHGGHLTEFYREVFIVLFRRTTQVWGSQIASIVRVRLCQAGAPQATVRPERVDIRVDDAAKAEIIARLGLKATHLISDKMVTSPIADAGATSRLEEVSEQAHALSTDTADSRIVLPDSLVSSTSRRYDRFSHIAPQTCFPAPYPPPPPKTCIPRNALPTSFIPSHPLRDVRSSASHSPDMSTLTNLFARMTIGALETNSRIPESREEFCIPDPNRIQSLSPILSPSVADNSTKPQLAIIKSITSPTNPTNTPRRRKIASLPTRRGKPSASPSPPAFHSAGATSHPTTPRRTERVAEETPDYVFALPQKTHHSQYTAEASCGTTPKSSTPRQRKIHPLRKTLPHSHAVPHDQALTPLATPGGTLYTVLQPPPLASDATSYFDSPPTSSDELDTPPSTPPSLHVLLASTSTESLTVSSESVSHKEPLGYVVKLPNPGQRYKRLDFKKRGLAREAQPLTFTFSV